MAADNPFRDNSSDTLWKFDDYDYIFTETGTTKGNQIKTQYQNHTMNMDEMKQFGELSTPYTPPSFVSSNMPTPPPLPSLGTTDSALNDKLNDDFWSDLIESSTPLAPMFTPSRTNQSSFQTPPKTDTRTTNSPCSTASRRRSLSTKSVTNPSDLAFGIQLNTPKRSQSVTTKPKRKKKRKKSKKRSKKAERKQSETDSKLHKLEEKIDEEPRRSSYVFGCDQLMTGFDASSFDVESVLYNTPTDLFEIGKIVNVLKGKHHGWALQKYLFLYETQSTTSPIFEITHPTKGKHLVLGVYPRFKDLSQFIRNHPVFPLIEEYRIDTIYTPVKYTNKSGFNYSLQTLIASSANIKVEDLNVLNEEYNIINKEFHRQCEKLFDKILYGKGFWKKIPGVDSVFITHWNTFMHKYRLGVESCYLHGDLKGYILLVAMFWSVVLRFKKENRCKDLSKVLSARMSYRICSNLEKKLDEKKAHSSITLVSLNLLFRPNGIFQILKQNGWDIQSMSDERIETYRKRNGVPSNALNNLEMSVQKVGKHAGKVMSWSRNRESCVVM
eukprot:1908_1